MKNIKKWNYEDRYAYRYNKKEAFIQMQFASFERRCGRHANAVHHQEEAKYYHRQAMAIYKEHNA